MADQPVGIVTHYYNRLGVAVVKLDDPVKVGDTLKFVGHDSEFSQEVTSMQVEHTQIREAKQGDEIGMKVDQPVHEHCKIYRVAE